MLNSPITPEGSKELSERHFRNGRGDYDNNKLMRYESYFKNPQLFVDLANRTVPFLMVDCLIASMIKTMTCIMMVSATAKPLRNR